MHHHLVAVMRSTRTDWLPLILILFLVGLTGGFAAKAAYRLTLGYIGGIWLAWYAAYNGSSYYQLAAAAAPALAAIASTVARGAHNVARNELDLWLDVYDPLGLVRAAIESATVSFAYVESRASGALTAREVVPVNPTR